MPPVEPPTPTPAALEALDLDAIKARRDAVIKLTFKLAAVGDRAFRMSIPMQPGDADVLLMKLCDDVDALLAAARRGGEDTRTAYLEGWQDGKNVGAGEHSDRHWEVTSAEKRTAEGDWAESDAARSAAHPEVTDDA
jgi:hypothetical protein